MTDYRAPRQDVDFILNRVIGRDRLSTLAAFEPLDEELVSAILDEAGRFAEQALAPLNAPGDRAGCRFDNGRVTTPEGWPEAYRQFRDAGWTGLCLPESLEGQGLPKVLATPVTECWQGANLAFSMIQPLTEGAVEALLASGDQALIDQYGPRLTRGDWTATMALTEPAAGSDLGQLRTRAVPDGDGGYRLFGQKLFISYGEHDLTEHRLHLVLARLPDAPEGSRGISLFAVPSHRLNDQDEPAERNDIHCTGIEHKLGLHGSPTCSLTFGQNDGARGELVGEPGRGLALMFVMMNEARLSVGLQGVAVIERAYQNAVAWASERKQGRHCETGEGPVALIEHPDIRRQLLRIRSQTLASRLLGMHLGFQLDCARQTGHPDRELAQRRVDLLTPVFKAWSTEVANRLAGDAIQVFGGMGYVEETGVAQFYRDLKIATIYEGTTGIQAQDLLFRKIQRDGGDGFRDWLDQIETDLSPLSDLASAQHAWASLARQARALRNRVDWLLSEKADDPVHLHAAAVPLLEATGVLASAWQLGLAVRAAQDEAVTDEYRNNVEALFSFYCAHWLPELSASLVRVYQAGSGGGGYVFA
ncbi:acyl-CoA dehydrogenase [Saccharospirillum salsuginis]|uniref:Acyl-CoA dehydrogenase n=1 Tax=Saccharospirillum salsuginis TaxID=418750 RepID=A0A918NGU1_9GAMM|nr:acyl-CoA dehydrogenase [Saccharospirillum salsuginis]GGX72065.1 acyl-CoA dehydrogenase [Saccharospirillum salsuginis]